MVMATSRAAADVDARESPRCKGSGLSEPAIGAPAVAYGTSARDTTAGACVGIGAGFGLAAEGVGAGVGAGRGT